ncbi:MAG TPA: hypothetical protein VFY50_03565, partial [Candidatus Nitrosocosmicus sp.]|nr:hypothetical protein [Candidatus Nitrosocosmicus sp.]
MSNAPVIPRIMKITNVSIPKNPSGLTNLPGNVNLSPIKIVRSTPAYVHLKKRVKLFSLCKETPISHYPISIRTPI